MEFFAEIAQQGSLGVEMPEDSPVGAIPAETLFQKISEECLLIMKMNAPPPMPTTTVPIRQINP